MIDLLSEAMESCVMLNKSVIDDDYGGEKTVWTEGASFQAAFEFNASIQAKIAQAQGATDMYTVTTRRIKTLEYHDVFKRLSDGKIFRVTSDGQDKKTPRSAGLDMRVVTAEEFVPAGD